jgi:hypothetical protein
MGWTAEESRLDSRQKQEISYLQRLDRLLHPASYIIDTGAISMGIKWPESEANHLHLVPRSGIVELYFHPPPMFS